MDFIRGIAVLGLVFMNGYAFGFMEFGYVPLTTPPVSDTIIEYFNILFIEGDLERCLAYFLAQVYIFNGSVLNHLCK